MKRAFIERSEEVQNSSYGAVFLWCLHCERTYRRGDCSVDDEGVQWCPYDDCDGGVFMDGWTWQSVRNNHPEYPVIPEEGVRYPLYD